MVASSLHRDRNDPWAVQIIAAPKPSTALIEYNSQVFGHRNDIINKLCSRSEGEIIEDTRGEKESAKTKQNHLSVLMAQRDE